MSVHQIPKKALSICKATLNEMHVRDQKHIDELVSNSIALGQSLYAKYQPYLPFILEKAKRLTLDDIVHLINFGTEFLKKKETIVIIERYIMLYKDIASDKKRLQAYTKYLKCLLDNIDPKLEAVVSAILSFAGTFMKIFLKVSKNKDIHVIFANINIHLLQPLRAKVQKKIRKLK